MPIHFYIAPAVSGKTAYLIEQVRILSTDLATTPRVVVPTQLQARVWHRRLAETGGALGIRVGTFDALYREILRAAGQVYIRLTEPIQYRLLRMLVPETRLAHYQPIDTSPGFAQVVLELIRELKAGGVFPEDLTTAISQMGNEPRLQEIADLYLAYQQSLQKNRWADLAGIGWLAAEALQHDPRVGQGWSCVMVDGFDDLTTVQLTVLRELSARVERLIITLTGELKSEPRKQAHRRFNKTRKRIESELHAIAEPLPHTSMVNERAPALAHLEATLFAGDTAQQPASGAVTLIAAPDREGEVRVALRWLKARVIEADMRPREVALLARTIEAYRPWIDQIADEFGLPIHVVSGTPLRSNPAVSALLNLLRLPLPGDLAFPWRPTVESWRSPYFDWDACVTFDAETSAVNHTTAVNHTAMGITLHDSEILDQIARWGSVIGSLTQWREAFCLLVEAEPVETLDEDEPPIPDSLPTGATAQTLHDKFERFVLRITPPEGAQACRVFVEWLENLIGDATPPEDGPITDLGVVRCILDGPTKLRERDLAALNALKDVLRGLVWAEEALGYSPIAFEEFLDDLIGAINTTTYHQPLSADQEAILVADVAQARGVSFRAVAVLGLAEGEFPTTLTEDSFLRDADRQRLRDEFNLALDLSTEGAEAGYFYEAVTRPREALLLTRPYIADNGATWQASPFWEEIRRRIAVELKEQTGNSSLNPAQAASWPEWLLGIGARAQDTELWAWAVRQNVDLCTALKETADILKHRSHTEPVDSSVYDGDLTAWKATFGHHFGPLHTWSASRLETYRTCPFFFFAGSVLGLEPRAIPTEGLNARQLGSIYHRIFEQLYRKAHDPTDLDHLLNTLPNVAHPILDEAPHREQFRATAWWAQTRNEIIDNVRDSLIVLDALRADYVPHAYEQTFGIPDKPGVALVVNDPDSSDTFRLRGYIDRVDLAQDGRFRIIDYKTGGYSSYKRQDIMNGKKLQLALYALAAQEALKIGEIADGFYWHVQQADWHLDHIRSKEWFRLASEDVQETLDKACAFAWEVIHGTRHGHFSPKPPEDGCPSYCPATAFCWCYAPPSW